MTKTVDEEIARQLANNPEALLGMLRNMAVDAVRWREALEECQRLARAGLEGFKEDLPRSLGFIEQTARQALEISRFAAWQVRNVSTQGRTDRN